MTCKRTICTGQECPNYRCDTHLLTRSRRIGQTAIIYGAFSAATESSRRQGEAVFFLSELLKPRSSSRDLVPDTGETTLYRLQFLHPGQVTRPLPMHYLVSFHLT
jgi:hypothetical protein